MNTAYVKIWGEVIGAVAWDEATGIATFEYDSMFKTNTIDEGYTQPEKGEGRP